MGYSLLAIAYHLLPITYIFSCRPLAVCFQLNIPFSPDLPGVYPEPAEGLVSPGTPGPTSYAQCPQEVV